MPEAEPAPATLANWRVAPHSRWAFRNVAALMPVAPIAHDPAAVRPVPQAPRDFGGFRLATAEGELDFAGFLAATATDALVILKDGAIAAEVYGEGMDAATPHIIMSATKSLTGLVAGLLAGEGKLDPDAEVACYVPEIAGTAYHGATVRQLLDMRAGVVPDVKHLAAYEAATGWSPRAAGAPPPDLHAFFTAMTLPAKPHGGPFRYISANTDLLGWVLERAAGESFASLASRALWQPLGAEADAGITTDAFGAPRCTGGVCATARDLARLGQLVLQQGAVDGRAIVPAAWIADIRDNGDAEAWARGEFAISFGRRNMHYRSGWYVVREAPRLLFAMGIYGQSLFVDPDHGLVIAKLSSQAEPVDARAQGLTHRAVAEIRRLLG
jgi:CubicO group peptidase (beta-lactamase class C family)